MDTSANCRQQLMTKRESLFKRLESAQADFDSVERLIAVMGELQPPRPAASPENLRQGAIAVLERHQVPMHPQNVLYELSHMDIHTGSKEPVNNLGAVLSRFHQDFTPTDRAVGGSRIPTKIPAMGTRRRRWSAVLSLKRRIRHRRDPNRINDGPDTEPAEGQQLKDSANRLAQVEIQRRPEQPRQEYRRRLAFHCPLTLSILSSQYLQVLSGPGCAV